MVAIPTLLQISFLPFYFTSRHKHFWCLQSELWVILERNSALNLWLDRAFSLTLKFEYITFCQACLKFLLVILCATSCAWWNCFVWIVWLTLLCMNFFFLALCFLIFFALVLYLFYCCNLFLYNNRMPDGNKQYFAYITLRKMWILTPPLFGRSVAFVNSAGKIPPLCLCVYRIKSPCGRFDSLGLFWLSFRDLWPVCRQPVNAKPEPTHSCPQIETKRIAKRLERTKNKQRVSLSLFPFRIESNLRVARFDSLGLCWWNVLKPDPSGADSSLTHLLGLRHIPEIPWDISLKTRESHSDSIHRKQEMTIYPGSWYPGTPFNPFMRRKKRNKQTIQFERKKQIGSNTERS